MSADVRVVGGNMDASITSYTGAPIMTEVSRNHVAVAAMQAILGMSEDERRVILATHILTNSTGTMEEAVVDQAFKYADAFEKRRWR